MSDSFLSPKQAAAAEATLWRRGALRYLLGAMPILPPRRGVETLRKVYDWFRAGWGKGKPLVLLAHRRFGKSGLLFILAAEECIRHPRARVAVVCDSKEHASDISTQVATPIFDRAPVGVRPTWIQTRHTWAFPNGSTLELFGGEKNQIARARGSKFRAVFLEEARDHPHLRLSVETVYRAALSDTAGAQMIFTTTVPEQEDSDFEAYFKQASEEEDCVFTLPLDQNPDYPPEFYAEQAQATLGGERGGDFRREYLCEWIHSDDVRLIVPEFDPKARPEIVREVDPAPHWRWYCGLDPGGFDPTGLVWFAYDDRADLVYVARELQLREQVTTSELAKKVRETERELFKHYAVPPNIDRWADPADGTTLHNLNVDQGLAFRASSHDDLWGNMDCIRRTVQDRTIAIHPDCTTLVHEMTHCRRSRDGKKIQRDRHGHGDVLMALYYPMRNLVRKPRPAQRPKAAEPLVEMGLVQKPARVDIIRWLRRPYGAPPDPLPGMRRRHF